MTDENVNKITNLIDNLITPVKEIVEVIKHKVDTMEFLQRANSENVRMMRDQQSVMNKKLDEQGKKLDEHGRILKEHGRVLKVVFDHSGKLTEDITDIKDTLHSQSAILKQITSFEERNSENMGKINKRVHELEIKAGIAPPPELTIVE